ncbi:S26 family signal peptidase [Halovenus rubra]|uniref:S26 family signal peptidase n=2 Tax=Halovenus rubra TaxID=869890 RepID=A0ABD5X7W1_9EURY|nr:S26 family signal peptidase [Halovenus rubra]
MTAPGDDSESDPTSRNEDTGLSPADQDDSATESADIGPERKHTATESTERQETQNDSVDITEWHKQDDKHRPPAIGQREQQSVTADGESGATWKLFTRDLVTSVLAVLLLGAYLFAISGVWPPMVAIESGSMEPHMEIDDLVFLMDADRFHPDEAHEETGVVTAAVGNETGYSSYGNSGDVIVFTPDGNGDTTPIIHRAMFWVGAGDNWCAQANPEYLGSLDTDDKKCVAANAGFITKGDNNNRYDQASIQAENPVKPEWVVGTAEVRIPHLGWFRLQTQ